MKNLAIAIVAMFLSGVVQAGYLNHLAYQGISDLEIQYLEKIYIRYDGTGDVTHVEMIRIEDFLEACDNTADEREVLGLPDENIPVRAAFLEICAQVEGE